MLIAALTAILFMGGSGADWVLEQLTDIRAQVKAQVQDEVQRKQLLEILGEMKSISSIQARRDNKADKKLVKLVEEYDVPVNEIGANMLRSNLARNQYQQEMLAERFRMVELVDEHLWANIFTQQ